jgi:hypothetical protein
MMTTATQPIWLGRDDLAELNIPVCSDFSAAWQIDDTTIRMLIVDQDGACSVDPPNVDESGEDAWEWLGFDPRTTDYCRRDPADVLDAEPFRPGLDFWIEKYEHGMVRFAPSNESSQVDRQWDVSGGVALLRIRKPDSFGGELIDVVRCICQEYTAWCNGDIYGIVTYEKVVAPNSPILIEDDWVQTDSCWGFLGYDYAAETAKSGAF